MNIPLESTSIQDWHYVSEGGANLVVSYTGPSPTFVDRVLRIRKVAHKTHLSPAILEEEDPSVAFTDEVIIPLLSHHDDEATPRLVSLPVSKTWLEGLAENIDKSRPTKRRETHRIDTERKYAVLARNLVGTPNDVYEQVSVEIKPKWGFLPSAKYLSEASREIKMTHCRFCLHRLYRQTSGDKDVQHHYSIASRYCPLDLYSTEEGRVRKAVNALVQGWASSGGKGNNLKIFVEGQLVRPDAIPPNDLIGSTVQEIERNLTDLLAPFLVQNVLLQRLKYLQSHLDSLDILGLQQILLQREGIDLLDPAAEGDSTKRLGGEITLSEYQGFIKRYARPNDTASSLAEIDKEGSTRDLVIAHLLSATFKDCSMFVCLRRRKSQGEGKVDMEAFLVDCDIKSVSRLAKYARTDADLVQHYREHVREGGHLEPCTE